MEVNMIADDFEEKWDDSRISEIEKSMLQGIFGCRSAEAVEAGVTYAKFLSTVGITPENYPIFLKLLEIENHWVIDALIGDRDPFLMLSPVQPNKYIVNRIFSMLTKWNKGGIYSKNLSVILGVLQSVYSSPKGGYRIFPLSIANVNALGKHLDKEKGQDDPLNRVILNILEKLSELEGEGDENVEMEEVAIHASSIRNAFFDDQKQMKDAIPPVLLVDLKDRVEVPPRRLKQVAVEAAETPKPPKKESSTKDKPKTGSKK
jgi:hypothetical protein